MHVTVTLDQGNPDILAVYVVRPAYSLDRTIQSVMFHPALALMDVLGVFTSENSFRTPKTDIKGVLGLLK